MKRLAILILVSTVTCVCSYGQGEVPVNMYTGSPGIMVNLYTLTDHDLSESLTMTYNVNGVNLNSSSYYGQGWNLSVGGQISRTVRGLPDDFSGGGKTGWLYNSNYSSILTFANSSDLSTSTCTDEQADQAKILSYNYAIDTEPDLFSFSVGGYSGQFVFGNDMTIKLIPYQDLSIVPTFAGSPTNMTITSWTITTNSGTIYTLNVPCSTTRTLSKPNTTTGPGGYNEAALTLLDRDYNLYSGGVTFTSAWMLGQVSSAIGASLTYTYVVPPNGTSTSTIPKNAEIFDVRWGTGGGNSITKSYFGLMTEVITTTAKIVSTITTSSGLSATCDPYTGIKIADAKRATPNFKNFVFGYTQGQLSTITETDATGCNQMAPYKFMYNAISSVGSGSSSRDFWGFYNSANNVDTGGNLTLFPTIYVYPNEPANERFRIYRIPNYPPASGPEIILTGDANRTPNASAILSGTLSRIIYPTGGESDFTFEINQYYDVRAGINQLGGGMRIKSITYFDGINPLANIVKNFSYVDVNGHSTGRLISKPAFAIPLWKYIVPATNFANQRVETYSTLQTKVIDSVWRKLTAVTNYDISTQDNTQGSTVGYTHVTVTRPNAGSAVFDYYVPAAYGDAATGSNLTDWSPTTTKFARPANCPAMNTITAGETYGNPTFPQAEYDYERGLLWKKSEYNNSGVLVRLTQNTYQYVYKTGTQPESVVGLAYERFANSDDMIFFYGRYSLLCNVTKLVSVAAVTTYDEANAARLSTESEQFIYGSTYHKLVSQVNKTLADGSVLGTSLKYTLDYPVPAQPPAPTDSTMMTVQALKAANRNNTVIEQVTTITPSGGSIKTTSATLSLYRYFAAYPNRPLLRYQYVFRPSAPVTDFVPSYSDASYAFHADARYELVNTINEYTGYDLAVSATGENRVTSGVLLGYNNRLPVAQINQARSISVGFSDFETTTPASFTPSNDFYGTGRTGINGVHPYASLSRTLTKPTGATNYLLSFWAKPQSGATTISLMVTLMDANNTTLSSTPYTFTYTTGVTDYQYFTQLITVAAMPSVFKINLQGQGFTSPGSSSPSLLPLLDDIGFYPDYSTLTSQTYDIPFGVNSSTTASGNTSFTTFDPLGRPRWISDQDRNIRKRYTYTFVGQVAPALIANVTTIYGLNNINTPIQFVANNNSCISGVNYQWDFGSGYGTASSSNISPSQTYATSGTYVVNLKVTHPSYGQATYTMNFTVGLAPLQAYVTTPGVNGSGWVTLTASATNVYSATLSYQWFQRPAGTTTWNTIGNTSSTFTQKIVPGTSWEYQCTITANDGRTSSSSITVSN